MRQQGIDQVAGNDQGFLVGQGYVFAGLDGVDGRFEAAVAHGGCDHGVDIVGQYGLGKGLRPGGGSYAQGGEGGAEPRQQCLAAYYGKAWAVLPRQGYKVVDPRTCREHCGAV